VNQRKKQHRKCSIAPALCPRVVALEDIQDEQPGPKE